MASNRTAPAGSGLPHAAARATPFVAAAVVVLDCATDFLSDTPLIGVVTPLRLALAAGLVALLVTGVRLRTFRTRLDLPIGLLLLASAGTTVVGGHATAPLRGLLTAVAGYYLIVAVRRSRPESWRAFGLLALVCVAAVGTTAFAQVTNETPTGFCRTGLLTEVDCDASGSGTLIRAVGTFANPNLLAAFLVLFTPVALLAVGAVAERTARAVVVLVGVIGYAAVLTTFSRAGYVAAATGLLVLGTAYRLAPRLDERRRRLAAGLCLAALAAGAVVIWVVSRAGTALGVRGQAWRAALDIASADPLGVGLGRAGAVISAATPGDRVFAHAHNLWLNWLVEAGVAGLSAVLLITATALVCAARAAREKSVVGTAGLAALVGFFLVGMADHPANLDRVDMLFWLVLGLVMAEAPDRWRRRAAAPSPATTAAVRSPAAHSERSDSTHPAP
ncbi:O-antigen ligase family protein [Streptomyces macrosporus]|uniref:O-antigen ligase-related domain-containing protein n=1 Tax=Streptomyces macrosporus TaxID=44032 RepID=A0ABP5XT90_9ACTN